jgi:hypothetical protein
MPQEYWRISAQQSAVSDRDYSRSKLLQDVAFVKKFVIPLLKDSINMITTPAGILSPIAGVKYVHERNENKRKREIKMSKNSLYSMQKEMMSGMSLKANTTISMSSPRYHLR